MNFIIEFLPKKEKSTEFVFVVRAQNGYPIAVCDSLADATKLLESKLEEVKKSIGEDS